MKKVFLSIILCVSLVVLWFPINVYAIGVSGISAKAYVLIDAQTGTVIAAKSENNKLPMASTTKIMTTLLMLESGDLDEEFIVDSEAIKTEGSSMGLVEGDIVTKLGLCYGMMLPSGNDAANATAVKLAGDFETFASMMNSRAAKIGMMNTHFVTPSGLNDIKHYSTAYDMALLTREAFKNDTFKEICKSKTVKLSFGNPPYDRWLANSNKLLAMYEYCIGVKTGFTDEAGRCLVSAAEKDGVTLICVTLNDKNDWNDHISLYDYGFSVVKTERIPYDIGDKAIGLVGGIEDKLSVCLAEHPTYNIINGNAPEVDVKLNLPQFVYAPVKCGDIVGHAFYYSGDILICETDIIAKENYEAFVKPHKKSLYNIIIDYLKGIFK